MKKNKYGLTLIEVIIVLGIMLILFAFTNIDFIKSRNQIAKDTTITSLISDIKSQQLSTMNGYNDGGSINPYHGIHFEANKYVLFHSTTYNSSDTNNLEVNNDNSTSFSVINFPNNQILFASSSGEIDSYDPTKNSVTVSNTANNISKTIYLNKYGVVTLIQ